MNSSNSWFGQNFKIIFMLGRFEKERQLTSLNDLPKRMYKPSHSTLFFSPEERSHISFCLFAYSTIYCKYRATNFANGLGNCVTMYLWLDKCIMWTYCFFKNNLFGVLNSRNKEFYFACSRAINQHMLK